MMADGAESRVAPKGKIIGMNCTRKHHRFDTDKLGFVALSGSDETIACLIPNMSLGGAYLRFDDRSALTNIRAGDVLQLSVPEFSELRVRMVRSDGKGAGVEFCDEEGAKTTVDQVLYSIVGHLKSVVQLWMRQTA
jgi:PilZ domain